MFFRGTENRVFMAHLLRFSRAAFFVFNDTDVFFPPWRTIFTFTRTLNPHCGACKTCFFFEKSHFRKKFSFLLLSFELLFVVLWLEKGKYAVRGLETHGFSRQNLRKHWKLPRFVKQNTLPLPKEPGIGHKFFCFI